MQTTLNTDLLSGMIKNKRGRKGLRTVATEIGASAATLSRIEQGKIPDVETFIKVCGWLEMPTDTFILSNSEQRMPSTHEHLVAHLRAERELNSDTIQMLIRMIDMAYESK